MDTADGQKLLANTRSFYDGIASDHTKVFVVWLPDATCKERSCSFAATNPIAQVLGSSFGLTFHTTAFCGASWEPEIFTTLG